MAQGYINLEIDPEQYEKVKAQLTELYELADRASYKIEIAAQPNVQRTAFAAFCGGVIFGMFVIYVLASLLNGIR